MTRFHILYPDWPIELNVGSCIVGRPIGEAEVKQSSFEQLLNESYGVKQVQWLKQVHGNEVIRVPQSTIPSATPIADACYTRQASVACGIRTADCLPIFLCNHSSSQVALMHAGWRSLASGIITKTIAQFPAQDKLYASLGPAISVNHYEVGSNVYDSFEDKIGFIKVNEQKWQMDLYQVAINQLEKCGVRCGPKPSWCTYSQPMIFYSYRREGLSQSVYDRIANFIWLN